MSPAPPLEIFTPRSLPAGVAAGVVARTPGLPDGRPLSFSAGLSTTESQARESRSLLASYLGVPPEHLVFLRQLHGARVVRVTRASDPGEADGMVTNEPGVALCLSVADCCAILLHDPLRQAVGALHAGWRGARDGIAAAGIAAMVEAYGTRARDLLAYLSPCASGGRYEVGEEVARLFPDSVRRVQGEKGRRLCLDLPGEITRQLLGAGMRPSAIEISPVCTIADLRCHSHRRDGAASGRMAAFILLPAAPLQHNYPAG